MADAERDHTPCRARAWPPAPRGLRRHAAAVALAALALPASAADPDCLLRELKRAPDGTTVAEVRARCGADAAPPAGVPPSDARDAGGEIRGGTIETEARTDDAAPTPIEQRFATEIGLAVDRLGFLPHRPNYLMPVTWARGFSSDEPGAQPYEIQFQVSLKLPFSLPRTLRRPTLPVLYFAYTGTAWWQAYDPDRSAPFREYNHSPELFAEWQLDGAIGDLRARLLDVGFEHQSNGRGATRSRSWNRLFAQLDVEYGRQYWASLRAWWRIPEDPKSDPDAAAGDDNPDITRTLGHGELRFGQSTAGLSWNVMLRRAMSRGGKGAVDAKLTYPTGFNPKTRWFVRWFDGYGDSLIDYDRRVQRLGVGLLLNDWY